jgi:hypothetical protein
MTGDRMDCVAHQVAEQATGYRFLSIEAVFKSAIAARTL